MNGLSLFDMLAFGAPPPPGTTPNPTGELVKMVGMLVLFGGMFYLMMIRPQQKKQKEHAALLTTLKPGDKIVTNGGILGTVVGVKDKTVSIRSADTKLEVLKSSVSEVTERNSGAAQS